jgi:NACHT domain
MLWGALALAGAAGTAWLLTAGDGVNIAVVLTLPVTVLALLAAVFDWKVPSARPGREALWATCRLLADEVARREAVERNRFLADSGQGQAADVGFTRYAPADPEGELVSWRDDGGRQRGTLAQVAGFYAGLERGRLAVLGAPGSGKTVLINRLVLDLIERLPAEDPGPAARVPVRMSLPGFDPGPDAEQADGSELAARLEAWTQRNLQQAYNLPPRVARAMLEAGRVLAVLDGLDEMDPDNGPARRARAVVRALNHPAGTGLRPCVVACREQRYRQLAALPTEAGDTPVLQDVTTVVLAPLSAGQVTAYLARRFPHPEHPGWPQRRWQAVTGHVERHPDSPLGAALRSPLGLFLAVTAYHPADTLPETLIGPGPEELDQALLQGLIPAVCRQRPGRHRARHAPEDVTRWLTTLADHLHAQQARGGSATDLDLGQLWRAAGLRARYLLIFTGQRPMRRLDLSRLRTRTGRRAVGGDLRIGLAIGLVAGLATGLAYGLATRSAYGLATGLTGGIATGLAAGLAAGLGEQPSSITRPGDLIRQGIAYDIVAGLAIGLAFGLAGGLAFGPAGALAGGLAGVLAGGLAGGRVGGLTGGLAIRLVDSPWPHYFLAVRLLAHRRLLPGQPARFLDWACDSGLMRMSGISIQFRHQRLQQYLQTPADPPRTARSAEEPSRHDNPADA